MWNADECNLSLLLEFNCEKEGEMFLWNKTCLWIILYEVQVLQLMHSGDQLDVFFFLVIYQMCNRYPPVLIFFFFELSVWCLDWWWTKPVGLMMNKTSYEVILICE